MRNINSSLPGFGIAFCTTTLAFMVTLAAGTWSDRTAYALYVGSTIVSAFFGGTKSGIFATVLATGFQGYRFHLLGVNSPLRNDSDFIPSLILFILVGLLASYLSSECFRAVRLASRLQDTLGGLREGILVTDEEGKVAFLNEVAEALTSWPQQEAFRQPHENILRLVDEDNRRPIGERLIPLLKGAKEAQESGVAVLVSKSGGERTVEFEAAPLTRSDGKRAGLVVAFRDIGDRRRSERELRRSEEQFHALASGSSAGILFLDPSGQGMFCNRAFQELAGVAADSVRSFAWKGLIHPEDQTAAQDWLSGMQQSESFSREFRLQSPQGQARWVRLRSDLAKSEKGQLLGHVAVFENIDQRKQRELELEEQKKILMEQQAKAKEKASALEKERKRLQEQLAERQQAEEALKQEQAEAKRREEKLRQELAELAQKSKSAGEQLAVRRGVEEKLRQELAEWMRKHKSAEEEMQGRRDGHEDLRRQLAQLQAERGQWDETQRLAHAEAHRTVQQQLADSQARAKKLQKELDDFHADRQLTEEEQRRQAELERGRWQNDRESWIQLETELRQQLEKRNKGLLVDGALLERVTARLRPMAAQLRELTAGMNAAEALQLDAPLYRFQLFVTGLRALCQLPSLSLRKEPVELSAFIQRVVAACSGVYRTRDHHLTVALPLEPEWLSGDPLYLELALECLLDNAAQFTEPGGQIALTAERIVDQIVLRITDTSCGLAPDQLPVLMELRDGSTPFSGHADRLRIGLPLARNLVERHGGALTLSSPGPGKGCEVVLHLPAMPRELAIADSRLPIAQMQMPIADSRKA